MSKPTVKFLVFVWVCIESILMPFSEELVIGNLETGLQLKYFMYYTGIQWA